MSQSFKTRLPVWLKLTIFSATLAAGATIVMGVSQSELYEKSLTQSSLEYGDVVASDAAQAIELEFEEIETGLLNIQRTLTSSIDNPDDQIQRTLLLVESNKAIDHVNVYDINGNWIDTVREKKTKIQPASKTLDIKRFKTNPVTKTPIRIGKMGLEKTQVRLELLMPLVTAKGKQTGYLHTHISMKAVQSRIKYLVRTKMKDDASRLFVVDDEQRIVAHGDESQLTKQVKTLPHIKGMTASTIQAGVSQSGPYVDDQGNRHLAVYHPIPEANWGVVTQIPYKVAFAPLEKMKKNVAIVLLASVLISMLLAFLLARRLTSPIGQLVNMARAMGQRRFEERIEINTNDEFKILGETFNKSAIDLQESEDNIRKEQKIRQDLGRFLPHELVDQVVAQKTALTLGGKRVMVTALFADVVSFTPLCERLSPEVTVSILNELFTIITEIIFRHDGTVDKFMGDCVMAFWGPPHAGEDHATKALEAAEEIISWLDIGNVSWKEKYDVELQLAIGVNTGEAIVGNIGSDTRMEYTAIGDTINIAARLESIARPNQILTTATTIKYAEDIFDVRDIGQKKLIERDEPVLIYEVQT